MPEFTITLPCDGCTTAYTCITVTTSALIGRALADCWYVANSPTATGVYCLPCLCKIYASNPAPFPQQCQRCRSKHAIQRNLGHDTTGHHTAVALRKRGLFTIEEVAQAFASNLKIIDDLSHPHRVRVATAVGIVPGNKFVPKTIERRGNPCVMMADDQQILLDEDPDRRVVVFRIGQYSWQQKVRYHMRTEEAEVFARRLLQLSGPVPGPDSAATT